MMTKGEQMNEEDRLLEQGKSERWYWINQQQHNSTQVSTKTYEEEVNEQFLFGIDCEDTE